MPPNMVFGVLLMSLRVRSNASMTYRLSIVTSSIIRMEVDRSKSARRLPLLMLHRESSVMLMGTLNWECNVLPPLRSREALAVEAHAREIRP